MPLKINSKHKAVITYLRNFELVKGILDKLEVCESNQTKAIEERDKIYTIISKIYSSDYDLENEDAADIIIYKYKKSILNIYKDIANRLFLVDNGKVFLKNDSLADYNIYTTSLDIYPFFAQYLLDKSNDLAYKDSKNQANYLIAYADETFRLYGNIENKIDTISDMHIHLGASLDFHYRIHDILLYPQDQEYEFPQEIFIYLYKKAVTQNFFIALSILETLILRLAILREKEYKNFNDFFKLLKKLYEEDLFSNDDANELINLRERVIPLRKKPKVYKRLNFKESVSNAIFHKMLQYFDKDSKEYEAKYGDKLLVILYMHIFNTLEYKKNDNTDILLKYLIWLYLIFRNITKLALVQQHRREGFGYFASYATNKLYKKGLQPEKSYKRLKSILHPKLNTNIEGRTTVEFEKGNLSQSALETKKTLLQYIRDLNKINKDSCMEHKLRFIYHFIKIRDEDEENLIKILNSSGAKELDIESKIKEIITAPKYSSLREHYKQEAMVLHQLFVNPQYRFAKKSEIYKEDECKEDKKDKPRDSCKEKNDGKIDLFKEYIAGIDAANKEYYTPPEVFSAVYSFFKNSITSSGLVIEKDANCDIDPITLNEVNLQYTFHAGEEYRDIISGLRAIYEAVVFLNLKDEDRIGHAVALGIDPKLFLQNRRSITLTKGEYLDNLLFLYFLLGQRDDSPISLELLKNRIYRIASEIYNHNFEDKGYKIDDYVDAWLLRRNCPNEINTIFKAVKDDLDSLVRNGSKLNHLKKQLESVIDGKLSKTLFVKELITTIPNILEMIETQKYENIYIKNALPDFFNHFDNSLEPLKRYMKIKNNPNAYELYDKYAFDPLVTYRTKQVYNENPAFEPDIYEFMQDLIMEDVIVKKNIIIEILPTSNILITSINDYENHHFLRLNPPKEITPNRFGLRKGKIKLILGTDDPGIQGTNLIMEIYHIKNVIAKKYDKKIAEKYVLEMLKLGNYVFNKR